MSEERIAETLRWIQGTADMPAEAVVRVPFGIVVSSLSQYRQTQWAIHVLPTNSSHVICDLSFPGDGLQPVIASLTIRSVIDANRTHLKLEEKKHVDTLTTDQRMFITATLKFFLWEFINWLHMDSLRMQALDEATVAMLVEPPAQPAVDATQALHTILDVLQPARQKRKPGAPRDPDNEWARREAELGRDYDAIFEGYLQRQNVDIHDSKAVRLARDRFRKMMGAKRRK